MTKPLRRPSLSSPTTARSGRGIGWLILAIVILAVAMSAIVMPDTWKALAGSRHDPETGLGPKPKTAESAQAELGKRSEAGSGLESMTPSATKIAPEPPPLLTISKPPASIQEIATIATPVERNYPGEARAQALLTEAEASYRVINDRQLTVAWQTARAKAERVAQMDAKPATISRAKDIVKATFAFEKLFSELSDRDELTRNYDTSPALVTIGSPSSRIQAVPLMSVDPIIVADEIDPLSFIDEQRRNGPMAFMIKGRKDFIPTKSCSSEFIGEVEKVDVESIRREREAEFTAMLSRVQSDTSLSGDATTWYDLGKFAFRNRIDGQVIDALDRALFLEPNLVKVVRNEKAQLLAAVMMVHIKNGNPNLAAPYMAKIRSRYLDTDAGKMAEAEFSGRQSEKVAIAKDMARKQKEEEVARQQELSRRAEEKKRAGDAKSAKLLEDSKRKPNPSPEDEGSGESTPKPRPKNATPGGEGEGAPVARPQAPAASGDEAKADELFERARRLAGEAVEMSAGQARNAKYREAQPFVEQAIALYLKITGGNIESKTIAAKQLGFLIRKSQTLH